MIPRLGSGTHTCQMFCASPLFISVMDKACLFLRWLHCASASAISWRSAAAEHRNIVMSGIEEVITKFDEDLDSLIENTLRTTLLSEHNTTNSLLVIYCSVIISGNAEIREIGLWVNYPSEFVLKFCTLQFCLFITIAEIWPEILVAYTA